MAKAKNGKKSIKTQLIVFTSLAVAIPLVIATMVSVNKTIGQGLRNVTKMNTVQVKNVEMDLSKVIDKNIQLMQTLATSPAVVSFVSGDESFKEQVDAQLLKVNGMFEDDNLMAIANANGDQIAKTNTDLINIGEREYFLEAMKGNVYVSDIQISKRNGNRMCTFSVPVKNFEGNTVIGVIHRNIDLNVFQQLLAEEVNEERMEIVVVDCTGSVLAHSGHEIKADSPEDQSMNPFYTDSRGDKTHGYYDTTWEGEKWMVCWRKEPVSGWVIAACRVRSVTLNSAYQTAMLMAAIGVISFVAAMLVAMWYAGRLANPIRKIADIAEEMAHGDLTQPDVNVSAKNEIGVLAHSFNTMKNKIAGVLSEAQNSAGKVAESTQQFNEVSEQSADALATIAEGATNLASGATEQKNAVTEASDMVDTMVDSIRNVKDNSVEVMEASNKVSEDAANGQKKLERAVSRMNELKASIEDTDCVIKELAEQSKKIGSIVETISSISEQTNLLSLNASIEAARAGEAGRGFAVVATEVGSLAIESKEAVSEIAGIVNEIQQRTIAATRSMSVGTEQTAESAGIVEDAAQTFNAIADEINGLVRQIKESVSVAEESMDAGERVKVAIEQVDGIANDIVDNTSMISASTQEQTASIEEIASASKEMSDVADDLKAQINRFKLTDSSI
ncbi:MAG: methyl-accepting chemotaxis protein [Lachnospiraceae bacterium]|jgi:methyl-accepting chemotaxis protein|nr:methyl-accepting chemotaxis protein [Lachnospiraceae bacterium]